MKTPKKIAEFRTQFAEIENGYRLEIEFPETITRAREWELDVVGAEGTREKGLLVVYPRRLIALKGK